MNENAPMPRPERESIAKAIRDIWSRVLKIRILEATDNFFALGGTSISAVSMLNLVEDELTVSIELVDFFDHPTLGDFTDLVRHAREDADRVGDGR